MLNLSFETTFSFTSKTIDSSMIVQSDYIYFLHLLVFREQLDQLKLIASFHSLENPLALLPSLDSYHTEFTALPGNARYFASNLSTLPMNNQMASIGACPKTHGPWAEGQKMEWSGLSGVY